MKVFSVRVSGEKGELKIEGLAEILSNIADNFLFCGSGKAGYRDRIRQAFFHLQLADEVADVQVIDAEILAPCREAVGLVNNKAHYVPG